MHRHKVELHVTLTIEVNAHDHDAIRRELGDAFNVNKPRDPLEGMKFTLDTPLVQEAQIMTCVLEEAPEDIEVETLYPVHRREWDDNYFRDPAAIREEITGLEAKDRNAAEELALRILRDRRDNPSAE